MLIQHAWTICDADRLDAEIEYLKKIFRQNGYNDYDIKQALCHKKKKPTGVAVLPYQQAISHKISRLLFKYSIKTFHIPASKVIRLLRPVMDILDLKVAGIYCIPCKHGEVCVGQTGQTIEARCKDHMRYV
jgi:hypothetical protein